MSQDKIDDRGTSDSLDLYNEELARKAVGSLFDDDAEDDTESSRYVTGFDRPVPARRPRGRESTREAYESSYVPDANEGEGEDPSVYAYRKRERSKETTPAPRPAVKVNVASAPPRGARGQRYVRPVTSLEEGDNIEDEYEAFRLRDKKRTVEPPTRPETAPVRGRALRERSYEAYDNEPAGLGRWVAAALAFVFLIILAFLVYRISVISGELEEARATIEATPSNEAEITEMRLSIEKLEAQLVEKEAEIEQLRSGATVSQPTDDQPPAWQGASDEPSQNPADQPPASNESTLPTVYTVVKGDNLTKICNKFYGSASLANIQKVKDANNLTSDNIAVGQKLTIPE